MNITINSFKNYTKISILVKRLDITVMEEIKSEISPLLEEHKQILLDMSVVEFLDSSGLSVLIGLLKKTNQLEGAKLVLCALTQQPHELMEITQLHNIFKIIEDCNTL